MTGEGGAVVQMIALVTLTFKVWVFEFNQHTTYIQTYELLSLHWQLSKRNFMLSIGTADLMNVLISSSASLVECRTVNQKHAFSLIVSPD